MTRPTRPHATPSSKQEVDVIQLPVSPMLAFKIDSPGGDQLPPDRAFPVLERRDMAYEPKWDGHRLIVAAQGGRVTVWTRSQRDVSADWPEIRTMFAGLAADWCFDGELLVVDDAGRPSINALALAGRLSTPQRRERTRFAAFDVLEDNGLDIRRRSYSDRRGRLEEIVPHLGPGVILTPSVRDGRALWNMIIAEGMEGIIAKPLLSRYLEGERGQWLKIKALQQARFLIVGYTSGAGTRADAFGAVILGELDPEGRIRYAGKCGTGWTSRTADAMLALMRPLAIPEAPFVRGELVRVRQKIGPREVTWIRPGIAGVVEFSERTPDGIPKFPAWKGLV